MPLHDRAGSGRDRSGSSAASRQSTWDGPARFAGTAAPSRPPSGSSRSTGVYVPRTSTSTATTRPTAASTGDPPRRSTPTRSRTTSGGRGELGSPVAPGTFGENLTVAGIDLASAVVGETWGIGTATLRVTEPRIPCFKLGIRMGDAAFVDRFAEAARPGTYLAIEAPGDVGAGDTISVLHRPATGSRSAPLSAPTTATTSSYRSSSTWRTSPKAGAGGRVGASRASYELTDETGRSAVLLTRSARKSSQDRSPTARSGARFAPARKARAALPAIGTGNTSRCLPRACR